jgi:hypothetical protein
MNTIPKQLNITINTSVPGYQKIEYRPYMTIPDISKDYKTIMFDPLVKLDKNYVDKVPEELRKKQFFNEGLFNSLLNFTNSQKAKSLLEATDKGYIDNNIKITLDTIFPENSVLYINKNPYVIADVQWSSGNWKIVNKPPQPNLKGGINYRPNNLSYIPKYNTNLNNNKYLSQNMIKKENPQIAYYITIDMELRPGTSLTFEEIKNAKCNRKLNSIKKDWSGLTGAPYSIRPLYTQKTLRGGNKTRHKRLFQNKFKKKLLIKKNKRNITKKSKNLKI